MNCTEAINYIHSIPKFIRPLGNTNLAALLEKLGNPQNELKFIHLAGTNGKGSTAAAVAEILCAAGFRTGLFTSPFIEVFNERIRINGKNISDDDLSEYTLSVKKAMECGGCPVSEFAFITAVSFLYFRNKKCDFVVLETGMGGKLDATNIIGSSAVSVITSISLDHMQFLGDTVEEIAAEKCGIIKPGGTVVTYPNDNVMNIIETFAENQNARLIKTERAYPSENGFIYKGIHYPLALKGAYQPQNAAVALETIWALRGMGVKIPDAAIENGLKSASWPARFEFLTERLLIDGGHNIDGIYALSVSLEALHRPVILVMAMMEDKNYPECVRKISAYAKYLIATELDMPRCLSAEKLLKYSSAKGEAAASCTDAVNRALEIAGGDDVVCVCGSLYLAGEIRRLFNSGCLQAQ